MIQDVAALEAAALLSFDGTLGTGDWTALMALGRYAWQRLRGELAELLAQQSDARASS